MKDLVMTRRKAYKIKEFLRIRRDIGIAEKTEGMAEDDRSVIKIFHWEGSKDSAKMRKVKGMLIGKYNQHVLTNPGTTSRDNIMEQKGIQIRYKTTSRMNSRIILMNNSNGQPWRATVVCSISEDYQDTKIS